MSNRKALIFWGGWDGHEPKQVAERFETCLKSEGFDVAVHDNMDVLKDKDAVMEQHLIIPCWTMGSIENECVDNISEAVASGTGLAGCHGGMCDAFRESVNWQFITGGNWVSHPGGDGVEYTVNIIDEKSEITEGLSDFKVSSEQYYLHVDPAVKVLATTRFPVVKWFHSSNGNVDMPIAWTKNWGHGRVFYNALGHHNDTFDVSEAFEMMKRGMLWAAKGKDIALREGLNADDFRSDKKMF